MSKPRKNITSMLHQFKSDGRKGLAVLLDPDNCDNRDQLARQAKLCEQGGVDLVLIGGSILTRGDADQVVKELKRLTDIPLVLFPGNPSQLSASADAVLFLSLLSGRNPEFLIGHHVTAAPILEGMDLEVIPTGYLLIDGGKSTAANYMSMSAPIPSDQPEIAAVTALAGAYLGLGCIYMDAGSGANYSISEDMVRAVRRKVDLPLIIGGGIRDAETASALCTAGADVIVIGTAFEQDPQVLTDISIAVHHQPKRQSLTDRG